MAELTKKLQSIALQETLRYVGQNPAERIPKVFNLIKPFAQLSHHKDYIVQVEKTLNDAENNWKRLVERAFTQLSPTVLNKFVENFLLYASLVGIPKQEELAEKYDCNIPWAILMDPTTDCNLNCTGCWAGEYKRGDHLTFEELDNIIEQGKELGIYMYLYSGGEPLLRAQDIVELARKHSDCIFCAFTNATLVTPELAKQLAEVGNVVLAISVEGFDEVNDFRRGKGIYKRVIRAMDLLREAGVGFGFSTCYHRENTEAVASEQFVDSMIEKGCFFGWYFTYMPLGKSARTELLVTPEQRKLMYERIRGFRSSKDIFLIDFWNDGEFVGGCIAGGRSYLHINAHGDVEPCAFIHYADTNIRQASLLEALQSPLFRQYRQNQPFNENPLRPCPLLDNPDALLNMVNAASAYSTQRQDLEPVEVVTGKCRAAAAAWAGVADQIWQESN